MRGDVGQHLALHIICGDDAEVRAHAVLVQRRSVDQGIGSHLGEPRVGVRRADERQVVLRGHRNLGQRHARVERTDDAHHRRIGREGGDVGDPLSRVMPVLGDVLEGAATQRVIRVGLGYRQLRTVRREWPVGAVSSGQGQVGGDTHRAVARGQAARAAGCVRGRSRPARAEHAQCGNSDERQDPQISMVHANLPRFSVQARLRPPVYTQRSSLVNQLLSDPGCLAAD